MRISDIYEGDNPTPIHDVESKLEKCIMVLEKIWSDIDDAENIRVDYFESIVGITSRLFSRATDINTGKPRSSAILQYGTRAAKLIKTIYAYIISGGISITPRQNFIIDDTIKNFPAWTDSWATNKVRSVTKPK